MKVAVAGLGWWGKQIIRTLGNSSKFTVVAGMDPHAPDDAQELLASRGIPLKTDLESLIADPNVEGVILATPHALHEEQALAVLAGGKKLFCEKPLAANGASAERVLHAADKAGVVLGIGHERRFESAIIELFRYVRSGQLGKLLHLEANISHDLFRNLDRSNWRLDPRHAPAGMMTAVGIHVTDIFVALAGPAAEVTAITDSMVLDKPAIDYISASMRFKSGCRGTVTFLSTTPYHGRICIFGDKGWVELVSEGNVDQGKPTILTYCAQTGGERLRRAFEANDAVLANFEAWADGVAGAAAYPFSRAEMLGNIQLFEAIVTSASRGGAPVAVA